MDEFKEIGWIDIQQEDFQALDPWLEIQVSQRYIWRSIN
jgi:hypothetical protein